MKKKMLWAGVPLAASLLYLLSIKPAKLRKKRFEPFEKVMIAHRGLYDNSGDAPENSLTAFKKAVDSGYGIELDVQLTKDGKLVVFHDETLKRMCGADVKLTDLDFDELKQYKLADSEEHIPLFEDVFSVFRDKAPVLIELKPHGKYIRAAVKLMEYLDGYEGDYCIQSFHPSIVRWFKVHRPDVLRGQLSTVFAKPCKAPWPARFVTTNLMTDFYAKPDFISYDYRYMNQFSYSLIRRLYTVENAVWVIQSQEDLEKAREVFDIIIFDSFIPEEKNDN